MQFRSARMSSVLNFDGAVFFPDAACVRFFGLFLIGEKFFFAQTGLEPPQREAVSC